MVGVEDPVLQPLENSWERHLEILLKIQSTVCSQIWAFLTSYVVSGKVSFNILIISGFKFLWETQAVSHHRNWTLKPLTLLTASAARIEAYDLGLLVRTHELWTTKCELVIRRSRNKGDHSGYEWLLFLELISRANRDLRATCGGQWPAADATVVSQDGWEVWWWLCASYCLLSCSFLLCFSTLTFTSVSFPITFPGISI